MRWVPPPALDPAVPGDIQHQLRAAYDTIPGTFEVSDDGTEAMLRANLLALPVPVGAGREA